MGSIKVTSCPIAGMFIIEPTVYFDERGYFFEAYNISDLSRIGIDSIFVQDNQSKSQKGVLRGLHFQKHYPQGKLIRVLCGEVFDVGVDLRRASFTFGQWFGVLLSAENKKQLYLPIGIAHGFLTLSDEAEFLYKCTEFYHPEDERGIIWNDPDIGIDWPIPQDMEIILSEKDQKHPNLENALKDAKL